MTGMSVARRRGGASYQWSARAFGLPAVLVVAVLLYLPFVWTSVISFTEYNGLGSPEWVGLANYSEMFADPNFVTSLRNTLLWVVGTITVPVGFCLFCRAARAVFAHSGIARCRHSSGPLSL